MLKLLILLLAAFSAFGADYTCTSTGAGNLSDSSKWSSCNSTYPHNNGGDRYTATVNHAITADVAATVGLSGAPVYGYVNITPTNQGSGYQSCAVGQISGGTDVGASRSTAALVYSYVEQGKCILYMYTRGAYSAGTPTLGSITSTNPTIAGASTTKGNPTTLVVTNVANLPYPVWPVGSTQSITISGATATGGWGALNATFSATVTAVAVDLSTTTITIPLDSSGFTGTPAGTISAAPGTAASYSLTYVAGGGTPAITVGTAGTLTIAGVEIIAQGDVKYTDQFNNFTDWLKFDGAGGNATLTLDSSGAAGTPIYSITDDNNHFSYRTLRTTGCTTVSGHICTMRGTASAPMRIYMPSERSLVLAVDGLQFYKVGDAWDAAIFGFSTQETSLVNSKFDTSGRIVIQTRADSNVLISHNQWVNSPYFGVTKRSYLPVNEEIVAVNDPDPGITRVHTFNALDGQIGKQVDGASGSVRAFAFFGDIINQMNVSGTAANAWSSFRSELFLWPVLDLARTGAFSLPGSWDYSYLWFDADQLYNYKFVAAMVGNSLTASHLVHGFSGSGTGDSGEWYNGNNTSSSTYTIQNSAFLCPGSGVGAAEIMSPTFSQPFWVVNHVTFCGGYDSFGAVQVNEGSTFPTGHLTFKNSLIFSLAAANYFKLETQGTPGGSDACSPVSNCDYNGSYNLAATRTPCVGCTNQGRSYAALWTTTPGVHDQDGTDPSFVAGTRKIENFDTGYLGYAVATAWSGGGTYAYGDVVSNSDAGVYGGETLNYRCINLSGCTGLGGPGINGTAWRNNWEFASVRRVADALYAQTPYTDCALGLNGAYASQALIAWVFAGLRPQASPYIGTASDGGNIGVPAPAPCTAPPSISRTVSISTGTIK